MPKIKYVYQKLGRPSPAPLKCQICGKEFFQLGFHISVKHDMTGSEYKKEFKAKYLSSEKVRDGMSRGHAEKIRSSGGKWTRKMKMDLKRYSKFLSNGEIAEKLGMARRVVGKKLMILGIKRDHEAMRICHKKRILHSPWMQSIMYSAKEIEYIKNNYLKMTNKEIARKLKRPVMSIIRKSRELNLYKLRVRRFSALELAFLRSHYPAMTVAELAHKLNRTPFSIRDKLFVLHLKKQRRFTAAEIAFIRKNFRKFTNKEIAVKLNRNISTVSIKIRHLGLRRWQSYSEKEIRFLKDNFALGARRLARKLNRSIQGVQYRLSQLNLRRPADAR